MFRFCSIVAGGVLVLAANVRPAAAAGAPIKVACIGEQTTHSDLFPDTQNQPVGMQEYPAMLQTLLGSGYTVMNYGDCCASVISGYASSETHPFISGNKFGPSISFAPDIVIIGSWGRHDWGMSAKTALTAFEAGDTMTTYTKFQTDYDTLVSKYIAAASKPKIFCSTPIPIPFGNDGPDDGYKTSPAAAAITAVCQKYNLPIIDMYTAFTGHKEFYINPPDKDSEGEHTSVAGMMETAQLVYEAITGADGGVLLGGGDSDGGAAAGQGSADSDASASGATGATGGAMGGVGTSGSGSGGVATGTSGDLSGGGSGTDATSGSGFVGGGSGSPSGGTVGAAGFGASGASNQGVPSSSGSAANVTTGGQSGDESSGGQNSAGGCAISPSASAGETRWVYGVLGALAFALLSRISRKRPDARRLGAL